MSTAGPKPALATAGVAGGGSLSLVLLGSILEQAIHGAPAAHGDDLRQWLITLGVKCAVMVGLAVWAFITARSPNTDTGLRLFDGPTVPPSSTREP